MVLLDDLLQAPDFKAAADELASDFRSRHNLPDLHQLGLVVPDVEHAALALEHKGIGPFFIASGAPVFWKERGDQPAVSGKLGMACHQGLELELLEPMEGSDFYRQSIDPKGGIVVQHLGFLVKDVDVWAGRMEDAGISIRIRGRLKAWPTITEFVYMEPDEQSGLTIEFISWQLFGLQIRPPAGIFTTIGYLEKWSGKRSIAI